jgi:hypothetical protein
VAPSLSGSPDELDLPLGTLTEAEPDRVQGHVQHGTKREYGRLLEGHFGVTQGNNGAWGGVSASSVVGRVPNHDASNAVLCLCNFGG